MFSEDLPESITFHFPKNIDIAIDKQQELNYDDDRVLHRQLICWLAIEKYWKWVIEKQKSTDDEIEDIENYIKHMEKENDSLENKFSPTKTFLHSNKFGYPDFVRIMFIKIEKDEGMIT